jgi:membrane protein required for beta-lactamase induction
MNTERPKKGLDDPRAVDILTTEHWSLLSTRTLGYQEMFGRATIFISILSAAVIALALLAQATQFGRETLLLALLLMSVAHRRGDIRPVRRDQLRGCARGQRNESAAARLSEDRSGAGRILRDGPRG